MLPLRGWDDVRAIHDACDTVVVAAPRKHGTRALCDAPDPASHGGAALGTRAPETAAPDAPARRVNPALRGRLVEAEVVEDVVADGLDGQDARAGGVAHALGS